MPISDTELDKLLGCLSDKNEHDEPLNAEQLIARQTDLIKMISKIEGLQQEVVNDQKVTDGVTQLGLKAKVASIGIKDEIFNFKTLYSEEITDSVAFDKVINQFLATVKTSTAAEVLPNNVATASSPTPSPSRNITYQQFIQDLIKERGDAHISSIKPQIEEYIKLTHKLQTGKFNQKKESGPYSVLQDKLLVSIGLKALENLSNNAQRFKGELDASQLRNTTVLSKTGRGEKPSEENRSSIIGRLLGKRRI